MKKAKVLVALLLASLMLLALFACAKGTKRKSDPNAATPIPTVAPTDDGLEKIGEGRETLPPDAPQGELGPVS